jgi:hypothetical protein
MVEGVIAASPAAPNLKSVIRREVGATARRVKVSNDR